MDQPPFYAVELSMAVMYSIGGLAADATGRTLGVDGQWIASLWHAGDVGQPIAPGVMGACPISALDTLAVRVMAAALACEIDGEVAGEVEPVGEAGVAVARDSIGAVA